MQRARPRLPPYGAQDGGRISRKSLKCRPVLRAERLSWVACLAFGAILASGNIAGASRSSFMGRLAEPIENVAEYGPGGCVATWKNSASHCVIRTKCKDNDLSGYEIKMLCIDSGGEKTRHVFGAGSFAPEETFDTLVICSECLADDSGDYKEAKQSKQPKLIDQVAMLRQDVAALKDEMEEAAVMVAKLNKKVFVAKKEKPAGGKTTENKSAANIATNGSAPAAAPAAPAKSLVHVEVKRPRHMQHPRRVWKSASPERHPRERKPAIARRPPPLVTAAAQRRSQRARSVQEDRAEADDSADESSEAAGEAEAGSQADEETGTADEASESEDAADSEASTEEEADGSTEDSEGEVQEDDGAEVSEDERARSDADARQDDGAQETSEQDEGDEVDAVNGDADNDASNSGVSTAGDRDMEGDGGSSDAEDEQETDESADEYLDEASAGQDDDA